MTIPSPIQIMRTIIRAVPQVVEHLSEETITAIKAAPESYDDIRSQMEATIYDVVFLYLSGRDSITAYKNGMLLAVSRAYIETADAGFVEGGADLPLDGETAAWARGQLDAQLGFVDQLFESLRELRRSGEFDAGEVAQARAESWASGLDGFYNEVALRGSKNKVVYWQLGDTEKHCPTCLSLDGKGRKISWYIERDYIPRKNGCALECGGWNCDCSLVDKDGNEITL